MSDDTDHTDPNHDAENCIGCQIINNKPFKMMAAGMDVITETFLEESLAAGQEIDQAHFLAMMIAFVQLLRGAYEVPAEALFDMMLMVLKTEDENFIQNKLDDMIEESPKIRKLVAHLEAVADGDNDKGKKETIH